MKSFSKTAVMMAVLTLMSAMPLTAQIVNGVTFKTSFPFYAGYAKMPAGSYSITQTNIDPNTLQIQSGPETARRDESPAPRGSANTSNPDSARRLLSPLLRPARPIKTGA